MTSPLEELASRAPERLTSGPLPDYRHLPGETPHPKRHPAGHDYEESPAPPEGDPGPKVLRGVDLYNRAYFWEAHEAWEEAWILLDRRGKRAVLLQGLIQVAAAHLKLFAGNRRGALRLADQGLQKIREGAPVAERLLPGWDPEAFHAAVEDWFRGVASGGAGLSLADWPYLVPADPLAEPGC